MESMNKHLGKVSVGVPSKPCSFTFVPLVQKLPIKSIFTAVETSAALTEKPNKNVAASQKKTTEDTMSDGETLKAEVVHIKDLVEGAAGNVIQPERNLQLTSPVDHMSLMQTSPLVNVQAENTPKRFAAASMETAEGKHRGISPQLCYDTSDGAEVSSDFFTNKASALQERTSPTNSYTDLFPTPASSRESILSEGWEKEKACSSMHPSTVASPVSFSRTVSPCSSVHSGIFSPAVVQVKRHCLAPGSSLVQMPQTCFSSCESLSSSICPQSSPSRHRPPLTRLSLLTAILRKGRLPILSPALQRPYSPCWPVNSVSLSSCNACSAAFSVASIPLEIFSRSPSSATESQDQSRFHWEPDRCMTAPPPLELQQPNTPQTPVKTVSEEVLFNSGPKRQRVISPPPQSCSEPMKSSTLPQSQLQLCHSPASKSGSAAPASHQQISASATSKTLQHTSICRSEQQSPESQDNNTLKYLKGHSVENTLKKCIPPPPTLVTKQETCVPQQQSHQSNSSLSNLRSLSQQLRALPSLPCSSSDTVSDKENSFHPLLQSTDGRCKSERRCPVSKSEKTPAHKVHCLSPSCYTPIVLPGWPSPSSFPTPDRFTLTPSPAPPIRDLTPSPSLSLRSTPFPRPESGISDCSDREGKKRKLHKIKLSYKSLAAIPTNTLLLDQQTIDDQVERRETDDPCDTLDTHAEMCSPAQLRQKSEELYAVIDEILADSLPACQTSRLPQPSRASTSTEGAQRHSTSCHRSLGRETKYASLCSLQTPACGDRTLTDVNKTRPGVIRPMTAIPRLTVEEAEEFPLKPSRQYFTEQTVRGNRKVKNMTAAEMKKDFNTTSKGQTFRVRRSPDHASAVSVDDLWITESEDQVTHPVKDGSWKNTSSFSSTEGQSQAFETRI
ncbi:hypothetical protein LDENG_00288350 [Lucifuga dentata]|nr:hypothetical protein LDENG_00288350 [Lucifuga dentata]